MNNGDADDDADDDDDDDVKHQRFCSIVKVKL